MTLVRIIKDWNSPDLIRQTPACSGNWDGVQFTLEPVGQSDFVIVLNRVPEAMTVRCAPEHIWAFVQEPPVPEYRWLRRGFSQFCRVYLQDVGLQGPRYIHEQTALPWHVGKNYDDLKSCAPPEKPRALSWITSNATERAGHRQRMSFLNKISGQIEFDLWGRGFAPLADKWDGLAPYRYSLAIENHSGPFYWTEKLADCFLGWAMPIYYGCTNLERYFPKESFIQVDIKETNAIRVIRDVIRSDLWLRNREAIAYARELVLDKYQFFPFATGLIREWQSNRPDDLGQRVAQSVDLSALPYAYPAASGNLLKRSVRHVRALLSRARRRGG